MAATQTQTPELLVGPLGISAPPPLEIECAAFTGSLATLFQLAKNRRIDLLDVPLFPVCEAYYAYLIETAGKDIDAAASALLALAYLLERKAWLLLPVEEEPESMEDDLASIEPHAHEYGAVIESLRVWQEEREQHFFRTVSPGELYEIPFDIGDVQPSDLARAFERLLNRAAPEPVEILGKPRRSLSDQMVVVLKSLKVEMLPLENIVEGEFTRSEAVWWFLALLELIRLGQAKVELRGEDVLFGRGDKS